MKKRVKKIIFFIDSISISEVCICIFTWKKNNLIHGESILFNLNEKLYLEIQAKCAAANFSCDVAFSAQDRRIDDLTEIN